MALQHHPAVLNTLTVVLAGGRGNRLMNLTDNQAKPAVPFGGSFRIIDFTLSNCLNSGFGKLMVATQYQSHGLSDYLTRTWKPRFTGDGRFINIRPSRNGQPYEGTADAIYKNIELLEQNPAEFVLILAGDHIYKMDYSRMLQRHIESGAAVTIPCVEVPRLEARGFGIMHINEEDRIINFLEKPADPPGMPDKPDMSLASMGIYVFNKKLLLDILRLDAADPVSGHDFGTDIIPAMVGHYKVMAYRFADGCVRSPNERGTYWRDVGTVDHYWAAHMDLTRPNPSLDVYDRNWPIYSEFNRLPQKKPQLESLLAPDCELLGGQVQHSLLFNQVKVGPHSEVSESVLLPGAKVGANVMLRKVIVGRDCEIPDDLKVGEDADADARRFHRTRQGIVLITQEMVNAL